MRVQETKTNEDATFKVLYDAFKNRLYGFVLTMVHSKNAAEEITQELFIKLWENRDSLDHIKNMELYIFTMARNRTLNYLRKAANDARILNELQHFMKPSINEIEERWNVDEYNQLIGEALEKLSPQRSRVFRLSRHHDLNLEEIAMQMDLSPNTVKNHLVAALRFIRSYLSSHGATLLLLWYLLLK